MFFRWSMLCLCLAAILAANSINARVADDGKEATLIGDIQVVGDIEEYIKSHPNVTLTPMTKAIDTRSQTAYYFGGRRVAGDRIVGAGGNAIGFPTATNYRQRLTYTGGPILTYFLVKYTKNSNRDRAYYASGGIGQRSITIFIETYQARRFEFYANFYGR